MPPKTNAFDCSQQSASLPSQPHTPGPWKVGGSWGQLVRAERGLVANCDPPKEKDVTAQEVNANARLIAAAPDLLMACIKMATEALSPVGILEKTRREALDAIAKAEGGAS